MLREKRNIFFVGTNGNIGNTWKEESDVIGFDFTQYCSKGYGISSDLWYDVHRKYS